MSKKAYTEQEREQVGRDLLSVGLEMLSQRGLKNTRLQDILQAVGISKPFFYGNYYTSLAELVIHIIDYEMALLLQAAKDDAGYIIRRKNQSPYSNGCSQPPAPFLCDDARRRAVGTQAFKPGRL